MKNQTHAALAKKIQMWWKSSDKIYISDSEKNQIILAKIKRWYKIKMEEKDTIVKDSLELVKTVAEETTKKTLSIIELITSGGVGGNLVMGAIGILSIFAVYILIERYIAINKASKEDAGFLKSIQNFIESKDIEAAKTLCRNTDSPIARMIEKGVNRIDKPMTDISAAIENQGKLEVFKMENNLANLATISGAAPMLGFLGTVIGMIVAFHEMASAGGNIDVAMLSQGIYTAMVTTVAGLVVGIIAFIAYNYLVSKVDKVIFMLEAKTTEFLDLLHHTK